jgi:hypothetical protein
MRCVGLSLKSLTVLGASQSSLQEFRGLEAPTGTYCGQGA